MAAAFKDEISPRAVSALGAAVSAGVPELDAAAFARAAARGLDGLELKARIAHVAEALERHLPGPFAADAPRVARAIAGVGLSMWEAWPAMTWIERCGLDDPDVALDAIATFTGCASGESAVRPYIDRHRELAWTRLHEWAGSGDEHLRRLASEGTRPRLPWAAQVRSLLEDPAPGLALIERLREDSSEYVRRSVANHLNDVARDHPSAALAAAERWRLAGGPHVDGILRRGLRGLVKKGEPRALALIGVSAHTPLEVSELALATPVVAIGDSLVFGVAVESRARAPARVALDYAIAYVGARGTVKAPKVFKGGVRELAPGAVWRFERSHPMRHVSIRRLNPGEHRLDVKVNGRVRASATFELVE